MSTTTVELVDAWISLTRLCGCNYRRPVRRQGRFVLVDDPHRPGKTYRLDAARYEAGERQFRGSWCIEPWSDRAAQTCHDEANWQT